jgi:hypothetical protein
MNLRTAVVSFPTPVADDTGHRRTHYKQGGTALSMVAGGPLNPTWVEWLMGFPEGWTELPPSGTPSSPRSPSGSEGESLPTKPCDRCVGGTWTRQDGTRWRCAFCGGTGRVRTSEKEN